MRLPQQEGCQAAGLEGASPGGSVLLQGSDTLPGEQKFLLVPPFCDMILTRPCRSGHLDFQGSRGESATAAGIWNARYVGTGQTCVTAPTPHQPTDEAQTKGLGAWAGSSIPKWQPHVGSH